MVKKFLFSSDYFEDFLQQGVPKICSGIDDHKLKRNGGKGVKPRNCFTTNEKQCTI